MQLDSTRTQFLIFRWGMLVFAIAAIVAAPWAPRPQEAYGAGAVCATLFGLTFTSRGY